MRRMVLATALLTAACTSSTAPISAAVTLSEFAVETSTPALAPGLSEVVVDNTGEFGHTLVVTDEAGNVVAATDVIPPGESTTLPVELKTGRYELTCRIVFEADPGELVDHFERGMRAVITVES